VVKKPKVTIKKGDLVIHDAFGKGIVLKIDGALAEIAFDYPNGVKKIMATHPSLKKFDGSFS